MNVCFVDYIVDECYVIYIIIKWSNYIVEYFFVFIVR